MTKAQRIGRCYCGLCSVLARADAQTVAYCHCGDCRRWTGAVAPAFAAFAASDIVITGDVMCKTHDSGVTRGNCAACGSPLNAVFPYLPDQVYVPVGVLDDLELFAPQLHCHAAYCPSWLHLDDDLPRMDASARDQLSEAGHD